LQDAEDARQHSRSACPLENREAADVADDVGEADQAERDQRDRRARLSADEQQRRTGPGDGHAEGRREPLVPNERREIRPPTIPADSDSGVQVSHPACAEVEQVEGGDRDEDAERTVHERLAEKRPTTRR
jgi:hypothetical protein